MRIEALAKLTLSLRVTGVRADGYHTIDAEMATVDLVDDLEIESIGGDDAVSGLVVDGPAATGVPPGPENLVLRALEATGARARVRLHKRIPPGAGLGGGSADAAAVLRWAGCDDLELAATLGADVPFCLVGGRARVRGIGEEVHPLPFEARSFTLLIPPLHVSTPAVYAAWDEMGSTTSAGANDLEPAALRVEPALALWRDRLGDATGMDPLLAGSGATWFVPGSFPAPDHLVVNTATPEAAQQP